MGGSVDRTEIGFVQPNAPIYYGSPKAKSKCI